MFVQNKREFIMKNHVYVQILINNISNFIIEINFLQIVGDS